MTHLIPFPSFPAAQELRYRLRPRPKKSFHTVLDAADMIDASDERTSRVRIEAGSEGGARTLTFSFEHPIINGRIAERLALREERGGLMTSYFTRSAYNQEDQRLRHEDVNFADSTLPLPDETYPEIAVPFLIPWDPLDGKERAVFAWVCDRFVARIRYKSLGRKKLSLPEGGKVDCYELMMYPDLNDWVHLGRVITRMIRPFLPKYRIWCAPEPPFHVLRYEGSYGPPGAPEIILEHC